MIWVDRLAKKIKERGLEKEWVDDMKTPSGRIHVGSLRGVVIHDLVYKVLKENGVNAEFSYVFNDMDPMDGLPVYLEKEKWEKYMGYPLYKIPSPDPNYPNFAEYFAQEFIEVFNNLNCHPKIIRSSDLHRQGKMNQVIKTVLDNVKKIREIYKKVSKTEKSESWYPYNPICQKCGKIGTTDVYHWDGKYIYYRCEYHKVYWADGCGYKGKVEPIGENGKLVWKIDWPAHWKVIGITIESSGKDHMSSGGSYDIASHVAKEVFNYNPPEAFGGYEWFTIGGRKMSSSKGVGSSAKEVSEILPPQVFRFLFVRNPITTHIDFNPNKETLFNLFDDYDRCFSAYYDKLENKIPQGKQGEVREDFARIIELSAIKKLPEKRLYHPRFRTIYNLLLQKKDNLLQFFENLKKEKLNDEEKQILEERILYAKKLLEREEKQTSQKSSQTFSLTENQKKFLKILKEELEKIKNSYTKEDIKKIIFEIIKKENFSPKEIFLGFYNVLIGQNFGPKAADLIEKIGIDNVINKINKYLN
ncbi:MAG: lysine--tRNA ligase [Patescibacteria group bacterium]|nr:MAG: lysine--tRNA ligase [Patescibacteria group bacterium]